MEERGTIVVPRRMRRYRVIAFAANLASSTMAMEACCGAHHMGWSLAALGYGARLMSPNYVCPYVKAQKNDDREAEAIAEAARQPPCAPRRPRAGLQRRRGMLQLGCQRSDVPLRTK